MPALAQYWSVSVTNISDPVRIDASLVAANEARRWLSAIVTIADNRRAIADAVRDLAKGEDVAI